MKSPSHPDLERVRQRAYFLWQNMQGRSWQSAHENWMEAYEHEARLLRLRAVPLVPKSTRLYTVHFSQVEALDTSVNRGRETLPVLRCESKDLESLAAAYGRIASAAANFDVVCAFACGGVALLQWIAEAESTRLFGRVLELSQFEIATLNKKLHLFPGLSWSGGSSDAFVAFIKSLSANDRVLVVDCSFTGGAVAAVANIVSGTGAADRTSVFAVVERGRLDATKLSNAFCLLANGRLGGLVLQEVPSLLAEDFPELLGYDALHTTSTLKPTWRSGLIVVRCEQLERYHVRVSHPLYSAFSELLRSPRNLPFEIGAELLDRTCADLLYVLLRNEIEATLQQSAIREKFTDPHTRSRLNGQLLGLWKRRVEAIARTFGVAMDGALDDLVKSVRDDRTLSRTSAASVTIEPACFGILVSLVCPFKDGHGQRRSSFAFPMAGVELRFPRDAPLCDHVPHAWRSQFDQMWAQLTPAQQDSLSQSWRTALDDYHSECSHDPNEL